MRRRQSSPLISYALSEFAFILLFLTLGTLVFIFNIYNKSLKEITALKAEVNFLNEILAEKENAIVPCWRRPDETIPKVVGIITIHDITGYSITHTESGRTEEFTAGIEERDELIKTKLTEIFKEEKSYAKEKNCYIRMQIINETNDFSIYNDLSLVLTKTGVVLVNE